MTVVPSLVTHIPWFWAIIQSIFVPHDRVLDFDLPAASATAMGAAKLTTAIERKAATTAEKFMMKEVKDWVLESRDKKSFASRPATKECIKERSELGKVWVVLFLKEGAAECLFHDRRLCF